MYQQGQFFGHFEILQSLQSRKYTVICVEEGELFQMSESLFKQKILHNESMPFKLKVMPILESESEDLLKKERPIKIDNFPKIRVYPALMAKKQNKFLTNRTSQFKPVPQIVSGHKINLNLY